MLCFSELLYCFSAQMLQLKNRKSSQVDSHSHDSRAPETSRCQLILRFNFTSSLRFGSGSERKVCTFNDLPGVSTAEQQGTLAWDSFYILCCLRLFYSASSLPGNSSMTVNLFLPPSISCLIHRRTQGGSEPRMQPSKNANCPAANQQVLLLWEFIKTCLENTSLHFNHQWAHSAEKG